VESTASPVYGLRGAVTSAYNVVCVWPDTENTHSLAAEHHGSRSICYKAYTDICMSSTRIRTPFSASKGEIDGMCASLHDPALSRGIPQHFSLSKDLT
jgi:hypothetical protein